MSPSRLKRRSQVVTSDPEEADLQQQHRPPHTRVQNLPVEIEWRKKLHQYKFLVIHISQTLETHPTHEIRVCKWQTFK
jgi:hypothetical protein